MMAVGVLGIHSSVCYAATSPVSGEEFKGDHVMAATKGQKHTQENVPAVLALSLSEAQEYAVKQNRSLRNASLAVQEAYAQRWQTIAAMLPTADASWGYTSYCGYKATMSMMGSEVQISMPDYSSFGVTAAIGVNGQGVVGAVLNTLAIDMQKIALEKNETELRASVKSSYVSVLVLQDIVALLDSSLRNVQELADMTQRSVDIGVAEQTTADQVRVRVNTIKNNINQQKRSIELATSSLKVLLDVPVETELTLTTGLDNMLSAEAVLTLLGEQFNIHNNLNYQTLEKNTKIAETNVHMAAWAYGPTVSLAYQYTNQHYYQEGGFRMTPPNLVSLTVKMPLWSSGKRAAGVVEKKIALEKARNTFEETADNLYIQERQLRYNLQNAFETYMNEKENMQVAGRVFNSTTNKFKYGTSSNLELVNASNDLLTAQSTYVQAVMSLVNAEVELDKFLNNK